MGKCIACQFENHIANEQDMPAAPINEAEHKGVSLTFDYMVEVCDKHKGYLDCSNVTLCYVAQCDHVWGDVTFYPLAGPIPMGYSGRG